MILSILIPSTFDRQPVLEVLLKKINNQISLCGYEDVVEVITDIDNREVSVGNKRQRLLELSKGDWVCYCDSDDEVHDDYIHEILIATQDNPDVIGFDGFMTHNGQRRENFKISKDLPYITITDALGNKQYERFNNHLSPVRRSIALQIGFKDLRYAEDYDYAVRLKESQLIKTEKYIHKDMYHYKYLSKK